jgi:general secretion pathway protein D
MRGNWLPAALLVVSLAGCMGGQTRDFFAETVESLHARNSPLRNGEGRSRAIVGGQTGAAAFAGATHTGSGTFVSATAPLGRGTTTKGGEGFELNLVDAPVAEAARVVLGDALGVPYVIDPRVTGTITLQTSRPVAREALSDIMEAALSVNGAGIVERAGTYRVVPLSEVLAATPSVSIPRMTPTGPGIRVQAIELQHISAEEMRTILQPISRQGSILRADTARNLLVIAGAPGDLKAMRDAMAIFDVDWMRGMSVALHPLKASRPTAVAKELETIFGTEGGPGAGLVRFVPNERLNAVLVISPRPAYLGRAADWIARLDTLAETSDEQMFVYTIQNRPAKELAEVLRSVLARGGSTAASGPLAPNVSEVAVTVDAGGGAAPGLDEPLDGGGGADPLSVVADVENNALLIHTTAREYERIERILKQLDVLPVQVLLEAVIAEVTLSDELKFGLRWFFESGNFGVSLSDVASGFTGASFPGFAWSYATDNIQVTLNALSSVTDVNVISAPTVMALNNQKAVLQVGDQVPIVTQQSVGTDAANAPIVNSVEMKDTGIILTVTPRVNSSGRVMLDIDQEVSNVVKTTSSGIDSPTIQQRRISTRVLVTDGESLALGGLIQERNSINRGQVPILGDIPVIGNAFKNKTDGITRTELIIFIRPRVVRDVQEARDVTAEFREQLDLDSAVQARRGGTQLQRDIKRLAR